MTWVGEEFPDDAADLSDAAVRTHLEALTWSNRRGLDLVVPKRDLRRFAFSEFVDDAVRELVEIGWWAEVDTSWRLLHRAEWQETREQVERRRLKNRRATWHRRGRHDLCDPTRCPALSSDYTTADTTDDTTVALGRDGLGRDKDLLDAQPTTELGGCVDCGDSEPLGDDGRCLGCFATAVAVARRSAVAS